MLSRLSTNAVFHYNRSLADLGVANTNEPIQIETFVAEPAHQTSQDHVKHQQASVGCQPHLNIIGNTNHHDPDASKGGDRIYHATNGFAETG